MSGNMHYSFTQNKPYLNSEINTNSVEELIFVCEWFLISGISSMKVMCQSNIIDKYIDVLNAVGIELLYSEEGLFFSKKIINANEFLQIDFKNGNAFALPSAIALAATGKQADLKGLESHKELMPVFQKEIYGFNINTDFCDYSKLKIYNDKKIKPKRKPVSTRNNFLNLCFIPLAAVFGKVEVELNEKNFKEYSWLHPLLASLNITVQKISS